MMHLGVSLSPFGHHPAAWRRHAVPNALDARHFAAQTRLAQAGALDFVFLADQQSRRPTTDLSPLAVPFEPTTLVAALATLAGEVGFVATAATGQHELYNLARRFASLDIISQGRAGWNMVASGASEDWNAEYVAVVGALWDSWDDDSFIYDKASGRFFRPDTMHVLNHHGTHFSVRGPLNVNRSPQGKPVITHVVTAATLSIAARFADAIFLTGASPAQNASLGAELRLQLDFHGRQRAQVRVLANVIPWIGRTRAEARDVHDELDAASPGHGEAPPGGCNIVGTAGDIADALQEWFGRGEVDGFTILPPLASGLASFVDDVVPELRRRGLFRERYLGTSLRDHLGLDRP